MWRSYFSNSNASFVPINKDWNLPKFLYGWETIKLITTSKLFAENILWLRFPDHYYRLLLTSVMGIFDDVHLPFHWGLLCIWMRDGGVRLFLLLTFVHNWKHFHCWSSSCKPYLLLISNYSLFFFNYEWITFCLILAYLES